LKVSETTVSLMMGKLPPFTASWNFVLFNSVTILFTFAFAICGVGL